MYRLAACLLLMGCGRLAFEHTGDAGRGDGGADDTIGGAFPSLTVTPPRFTTTSTQFVDVPGSTLTVPASPGQRWLLLVNATLESTSLDYDGAEARYLVDGVERGLGGTESIAAGQPGPWQSLYVFDGGAAPTTIVIQARDEVGQMTTIDQLSAVVVPFAPEAVFDSLDPVSSVTTAGYAQVASFTLSPAVPGEYLLLLNAIATEAPGGSDVRIQWLDPMGAQWTGTVQNPRGGWQSSLFVRRVTLPATISLQAQSGATASVQYVRVAGLPIEGLSSNIHSTEESSTLMTPVLVNTLLPTVPPAPQYLVLGTMQVNDDCDNISPTGRGAQFGVNADIHATTFLTANCAYEATQGYLGLHPTAPTSVTASYYSGTGENVDYDGSALFVLGVP